MMVLQLWLICTREPVTEKTIQRNVWWSDEFLKERHVFPETPFEMTMGHRKFITTVYISGVLLVFTIIVIAEMAWKQE